MKKFLFGLGILVVVSAAPLVGMDPSDWPEQDFSANEEMLRIHCYELEQRKKEWQKLEPQLSGRLSTKPGTEHMSPISHLADHEKRFFPPTTEQELFEEEPEEEYPF